MFDILTWAQQLYSKKVKQGLKICGAFYQNEFELVTNALSLPLPSLQPKKMATTDMSKHQQKCQFLIKGTM